MKRQKTVDENENDEISSESDERRSDGTWSESDEKTWIWSDDENPMNHHRKKQKDEQKKPARE